MYSTTLRITVPDYAVNAVFVEILIAYIYYQICCLIRQEKKNLLGYFAKPGRPMKFGFETKIISLDDRAMHAPDIKETIPRRPPEFHRPNRFILHHTSSYFIT